MRTVVLFSRDLRVHDHPALHEAAAAGEVVPLFVLDDALDPAFVSIVEPNLRAALSGQSFRAELPFGNLIYAYTYEPLRGANGEVLYALVLAQDITPLRQAEQRAVQSEAPIREIVDNMEGSVYAIGASAVAVPVPEPETYAMMLSGLGLLGFIGRRRKQKTA